MLRVLFTYSKNIRNRKFVDRKTNQQLHFKIYNKCTYIIVEIVNSKLLMYSTVLQVLATRSLN